VKIITNIVEVIKVIPRTGEMDTSKVGEKLDVQADAKMISEYQKGCTASECLVY
jgi:hypothetical protein